MNTMSTIGLSGLISTSCPRPRDPSSRRPAPTERREEPAPRSPRLKPSPLLWLLLFCICFGLGYPSLNRDDPRRLHYDARAYRLIVEGVENPAATYYTHRILVPYVAKPFYWAAQNRVGSLDPAMFGLLVSN